VAAKLALTCGLTLATNPAISRILSIAIHKLRCHILVIGEDLSTNTHPAHSTPPSATVTTPVRLPQRWHSPNKLNNLSKISGLEDGLRQEVCLRWWLRRDSATVQDQYRLALDRFTQNVPQNPGVSAKEVSRQALCMQRQARWSRWGHLQIRSRSWCGNCLRAQSRND
jgi:hypothetical protein